MNVKTRSLVPSNEARDAAFVACLAARDARKLGADVAEAASVYAAVYAQAMRGER